MSQRKTIRKKIQELLLNETDAEERVFTNRIIPDKTDKLPVINIYMPDENAEIRNSAPREYERKVITSIEITDTASEDIDDHLDDLCDDIEKIMNGDDTLEDTAIDVIYTGTQMEIRDEGENLIGSARLTYEISYFSNHGIDPDELDDLNTSVVQYSEDVDDNPETPPVTSDEIDHTEE